LPSGAAASISGPQAATATQPYVPLGSWRAMGPLSGGGGSPLEQVLQRNHRAGARLQPSRSLPTLGPTLRPSRSRYGQSYESLHYERDALAAILGPGVLPEHAGRSLPSTRDGVVGGRRSLASRSGLRRPRSRPKSEPASLYARIEPSSLYARIEPASLYDKWPSSQSPQSSLVRTTSRSSVHPHCHPHCYPHCSLPHGPSTPTLTPMPSRRGLSPYQPRIDPLHSLLEARRPQITPTTTTTASSACWDTDTKDGQLRPRLSAVLTSTDPRNDASHQNSSVALTRIHTAHQWRPPRPPLLLP